MNLYKFPFKQKRIAFAGRSIGNYLETVGLILVVMLYVIFIAPLKYLWKHKVMIFCVLLCVSPYLMPGLMLYFGLGKLLLLIIGALIVIMLVGLFIALNFPDPYKHANVGEKRKSFIDE